MASPQAFDPTTRAFLVERYLPPTAAGTVSDSVARVARLCAGVSRPGVAVQYLHSVYLPAEDTCFCVFRGTSADAVRDVNRQADFVLDRTTDALLLLPSSLLADPSAPRSVAPGEEHV
jgi:Protein of unknown function (DUF4242)